MEHEILNAKDFITKSFTNNYRDAEKSNKSQTSNALIKLLNDDIDSILVNENISLTEMSPLFEQIDLCDNLENLPEIKDNFNLEIIEKFDFKKRWNYDPDIRPYGDSMSNEEDKINLINKSESEIIKLLDNKRSRENNNSTNQKDKDTLWELRYKLLSQLIFNYQFF